MRSLAWIDSETTGLSVSDSVLEIACVITDEAGKPLDDRWFNEVVMPWDLDTLLRILEAREDRWVIETHTRSGLFDDIRANGIPMREARERLLEFIDSYNLDDKPQWAGSGCDFDRRIFATYWGEQANDLYGRLHHRSMEMQGLRHFFAVAAPDSGLHHRDEVPHRALGDIWQQIDQYRQMVDFLTKGSQCTCF